MAASHPTLLPLFLISVLESLAKERSSRYSSIAPASLSHRRGNHLELRLPETGTLRLLLFALQLQVNNSLDLIDYVSYQHSSGDISTVGPHRNRSVWHSPSTRQQHSI